jgi:hypothetical protein
VREQRPLNPRQRTLGRKTCGAYLVSKHVSRVREPSILLALHEAVKVAMGEGHHGSLGEGGEQLEVTGPEGREKILECHAPDVVADVQLSVSVSVLLPLPVALLKKQRAAWRWWARRRKVSNSSLSEPRPRILKTTKESGCCRQRAPDVEGGVDREEVLLHDLFHLLVHQGRAHAFESLDRRAQLCVRLVAGDALLLPSKSETRVERGEKRRGEERE